MEGIGRNQSGKCFLSTAELAIQKRI